MDYQVSARKWRPQTFEEVIGQQHVTTSLANAIRLDKIAQAYLFSGIRGVGKTSLARILAKGVNCKREGTSLPCNTCESCQEITAGRSVDVIEVDGASNTGVDDVRELRENVKYLPLRGRYKVYIIDEVHMLSNAAFNALLKTLEEPPPHLIFILATTESHKIPQTILSRCQHFAFRRMTPPEIVSQLQRIIETRNVQFTARGLNLIARVAEGSMRDALSLIDQAISFGGESVSDEDLFTLLGRMDGAVFHRLIVAIHKKDAVAALSVAKEITDHGCDLRQFLSDWLERLRHVVVAQNVSDVKSCLDVSQEEIEEIQEETTFFSLEAMQRLFGLFARLLSEIRIAPQPTLLFEVALMKAMLLSDTRSIESVIEKLEQLTANGSSNTQVSHTAETAPQYKTPVKSFENKKEIQNTAIFKKTTHPERKIQPQKPTPNKISIQKPSAENKGKTDWPTILAAIKRERANIGSYLEQGVLEHFDKQEIRIVFSKNSAFLIPLIQKDAVQSWLKDLLLSHVGSEVKLKLLEGQASVSPSASNADIVKKAEPVITTKTSRTEDHPLIQEALKLLGGTIIDTKRVPND